MTPDRNKRTATKIRLPDAEDAAFERMHLKTQITKTKLIRLSLKLFASAFGHDWPNEPDLADFELPKLPPSSEGKGSAGQS